jgi:hypothetical protein
MTDLFKDYCRFVTAFQNDGAGWPNMKGNYGRALNWHNP